MGSQYGIDIYFNIFHLHNFLQENCPLWMRRGDIKYLSHFVNHGGILANLPTIFEKGVFRGRIYSFIIGNYIRYDNKLEEEAGKYRPLSTLANIIVKRILYNDKSGDIKIENSYDEKTCRAAELFLQHLEAFSDTNKYRNIDILKCMYREFYTFELNKKRMLKGVDKARFINIVLKIMKNAAKMPRDMFSPLMHTIAQFMKDMKNNDERVYSLLDRYIGGLFIPSRDDFILFHCINTFLPILNKYKSDLLLKYFMIFPKDTRDKLYNSSLEKDNGYLTNYCKYNNYDLIKRLNRELVEIYQEDNDFSNYYKANLILSGGLEYIFDNYIINSGGLSKKEIGKAADALLYSAVRLLYYSKTYIKNPYNRGEHYNILDNINNYIRNDTLKVKLDESYDRAKTYIRAKLIE